MGLTLKVAKLPGLYGSNQTIPHTRFAFSKGGKIAPVHNTKGYWRTRGKAPLILYLGTRWKWVVKFTPLPLYPRERTPVPTEQEVRSTPDAVQAVLEKKSLAPTVQPCEFSTFRNPKQMQFHIRGGGPKNNRKYFFTWFIRLCTITNLVSFKVLSFWLDTLVPTFFPLLKTFLELFSADVFQDLQRFLFHFTDISKTFPFHLAFHTWEQKKVAWRKVGWIGRMRDNRPVVFFCQKLLHTQGPRLHWKARMQNSEKRPFSFVLSVRPFFRTE